MRFSIAKLLIATVVINVVVCLTFAVPVYVGFPLLTFISLFVLPPALIVGVVNTRGAKQAFFLGCMFSGIGHFIFSVYLFVMMLYTSLGDWGDWGDIDGITRYGHLIGYVLGLMGGLSGVGMYYIVTMGQEKMPQPAEKNDFSKTEGVPIVTAGSWDDDLQFGARGMVDDAAVGRWKSPK